MTEANVRDVTVIGGGPAGLFAAYYAGLNALSCKIIESLPALGGRLIALYPEKHIYDVAGFPAILARDLVQNLVDQAMQESPEVCLGESVEALSQRADGIWELKTSKGLHLSKTIILAGGIGSCSPQKHLAPTASVFEGRGLHYTVLAKEFYREKAVIVAGGGDSAIDWANELVSVAKSVTLVHRSKRFRAHEKSLQKLRETKAEILTDTEIAEFRGDSCLSEVVLTNSVTGESSSRPADSVVVMFGFKSYYGFLEEWGLLPGNAEGEVWVNERMETNLPGVFAVGDIASHGAKLKLIATGFAEAAIAVNFARLYISPEGQLQPVHSTTIMEARERRAGAEVPRHVQEGRYQQV